MFSQHSPADPDRRRFAYTVGLVLQLLGMATLAVLYPMGSPFYSAGIMLFELGILLSAVFLAVSSRWFKTFLLSTIIAGIPLQIYGMLAAPAEQAGAIVLAGIGLVCLGGSGIAGKEAYCFTFREGWVLAVLYPLLVLVNLVGKEARIMNALGFSAVFLLLLSLTGKKLGQQPTRGSERS